MVSLETVTVDDTTDSLVTVTVISEFSRGCFGEQLGRGLVHELELGQVHGVELELGQGHVLREECRCFGELLELVQEHGGRELGHGGLEQERGEQEQERGELGQECGELGRERGVLGRERGELELEHVQLGECKCFGEQLELGQGRGVREQGHGVREQERGGRERERGGQGREHGERGRELEHGRQVGCKYSWELRVRKLQPHDVHDGGVLREQGHDSHNPIQRHQP
ncbi:hypothetical protein FF38_05092 [Lucilia cuprina]|uniref:Uncharacterized protein n=1 Tax=Lucilia cuprina TaxID=7375 RepID=A0A0L0C5S5_LUCCU|nr:hypothetical protein FF38_05092 [Lucilia cuprina]